MDEQIARAAAVVEQAAAVIVAAGAGMGVDSGLPDFRGREGLWRAYPPYRGLGVGFTDLASPAAFHRDPELAWGFYGHRRALYAETSPHAGYDVCRELLERAPDGGMVFTSNVDGQFQTAGVDPDAVVECHGSLAADQCVAGCGEPVFDPRPVPAIDEATMRALPPLPACPGCGGMARPNVLMFGDAGWDPSLVDAQERRLASFLHAVEGEPLAVVEIGAGTAVPTVRRFSESLVARSGAALVRINPDEPQAPAGQVSIAAGGRDTLLALAEALEV